MNRLAFALVLVAVSAPAFAEIIVESPPTLVAHFDLGTPSASPERATSPLYDNIVNFLGQGITNGGSAAISGVQTTRYLADDIIMDPSNYGQSVTAMQWCTANFNASATSARMRVRFHQDSAGGPGTYITGFSFAATAIPVGVNCWTFDNVASFMTVPATTRFWVGITFDNSTVPATTAAQMNNLGMGLFDPPVQGASANLDFLTTAASVGNVNNPPGAIRNAPFTVNANHGWQLTPEPGTISLLAFGALALIRRRR